MKVLFQSTGAVLLLSAVVLLWSCQSQKGSTKVTSTNNAVQNNQANHHSGNPYPRIPIADFTKVWKGQENCLSGSVFSITVKDSFSVYVSGLFNAKEKVTGNIKGYVVDISTQPLASSGAGKTIEGRLILSNDRQTLKAYLTLSNAGKVDSCSGLLHL